MGSWYIAADSARRVPGIRTALNWPIAHVPPIGLPPAGPVAGSRLPTTFCCTPTVPRVVSGSGQLGGDGAAARSCRQRPVALPPGAQLKLLAVSSCSPQQPTQRFNCSSMPRSQVRFTWGRVVWPLRPDACPACWFLSCLQITLGLPGCAWRPQIVSCKPAAPTAPSTWPLQACKQPLTLLLCL